MSTQSFTSLEAYTSSLTSLSSDIVGALVFTSVDQNSSIQPDDLKQTFLAHQLPTDALPSEVSVRAAASKAASAVVTMLNDQAQIDISFHKETGLQSSSADHIRLGIYSTKCGDEVRLDDQFVFEVDKRNGDLTRCDHHVFRSYYQHYRGPLTSSELRNLVVKLLHQLDPVRILSGTFLPAYALGKAERISAALNDITGVRMVVLPLPAVDSVKQHAWQAFIAETREQLRAFQEELADSNGSSRSSTLRRRLDRYGELRRRSESYADLLGYASQDIQDAVEGLSSQVNKMLGVN